MTDEQLDRLEREAKRTYEWEQKPNGYTGHCQGQIYQDDLLALIADYRRLRELERSSSWSAASGDIGGSYEPYKD